MPHCILCNNLERKTPSDYGVSFDFDLLQLERSASSGCCTCSLLRNGIAHFAPCVGSFSRARRIYVWGDTVESKGRLEVDIYFDDDTSKLELEFFVSPGELSFSFIGPAALVCTAF